MKLGFEAVQGGEDTQADTPRISSSNYALYALIATRSAARLVRPHSRKVTDETAASMTQSSPVSRPKGTPMAAKKVTASLLTDNPNLKFKEILARGATRRPNGFDLLAAFGRRELAGASARYYLLAQSAGCPQPPSSIPAGTRTPVAKPPGFSIALGDGLFLSPSASLFPFRPTKDLPLYPARAEKPVQTYSSSEPARAWPRTQ